MALKIKVVTPDLRFPIRIWIPYSLISVLSSRFILSHILKAVDEKNSEFMKDLNPRMIKSIIASLKQFKGTELVNVKEKDGTEVKIIL